MKASEAKKIYEYPSLKRHGNSIQLKNSDGRPVVVASSQEVYMRGKGNFGIYGESRDAHRRSSGYNPNVAHGKIGEGDYRHESDRRQGRRTLSQKMFGRGTR